MVLNPEVVASLYEAAVDPARWTEALSGVCRELDAHACILMTDPQDAPGPFLVGSVNWSGTALRLYGEYYAARDPYLTALRQSVPVNKVLLSQDIISSKAFENTEVWTDYSSKHVGAYHFIGTALTLLPECTAGIGIHRPKDATPFDERARLQLEQLARHLEAALRMATRLDRGQGTFQVAALDSLSTAMAVVSPEGSVRYANKAASVLETRGPFRLGSRRAHIRVGSPAHTAVLLNNVNRAATGGIGGDLRVSANGLAWACSVTSLPRPLRARIVTAREDADSPGLALVTIREIGVNVTVPPRRLTELFELTKAEAAIVPLLLSGVTADHVANLRGVSLLTIQSQIRHILAKTGSANLRARAALVIPLCD